MSNCAIEKARQMKEVQMKTQESKRLADKVGAPTGTRKHFILNLPSLIQAKTTSPAQIRAIVYSSE